MLNEPPNRNSSDEKHHIQLRIPSVSPVFTLGALVVLVLMFIVRFNANPETDIFLRQLGIQGNAVLSQAQTYRLITAQLLMEQVKPPLAFIGLLQTILTLYTLYIVGTSTERLWGNLRFALAFFLGGAAGGTVSLMLVPLRIVPADVYLVAAPNAVMSVLAAEMVYMTRHRKLYTRRGQLRRAYLTGLLIANLVFGAFAPRVDLFGMIGALIGGAILAYFIAPLHLPRRHPDDPNTLLGEDVNPLRTRTIAITLYTLALGLLVLITTQIPTL